MMPTEAVEEVLARLRDTGGVDATDLASLRSLIDAQAGGQRLPDGVRFEPIDLGGVPAERVTVGAAVEPSVVMFIHGGAYMFGSAAGYRAVTAALACNTGAQILAIDYRLAPEHPFPAAVEDATAAYRAILKSGTPASQIGFAGDSAGAGLVIATMLSARDAGLPMPAAGYGMSPWLDLSGEGRSFTELASIDPFMTAEGAHGCAATYLQGADTHHPLASPLNGDFTGLPPLMFQVGSTEMFLDDSTRAARRAALAGVHVEMQVWPEMPHVWHRFPSILPEAAAALESGSRFLRERLSPSRIPAK